MENTGDADSDSASVSAAMDAADAAANSGFGIAEGIPGLGPSGIGPGQEALSTLSDIGFGNLTGFNPNNPDQTIAQMVASGNMHSALNMALPGLMASLVPGGSLALSGLNAFNALQSGKSTPGQALTSFGLGALGVPGPVVSAMQGQFGPAAGGLAQAGLAGLLSSSMGPLAGPALSLSGVGPAVGNAVAGVVPNMQDPGILSGISNALNQALSGFSLGNIAPGTPPTPGSTQTPDNGGGQDIYSVLAAIEQAAQEPKQPEWSSQMTAGRYGPLMDYQFGA